VNKISAKEINDQINGWKGYFAKNNMRGKNSVKFCVGEQWDSNIPEQRAVQNKESLTVNNTKKILKRFKGQANEIEFTLDVAPISKETQENVEETNTFQLLLSSITLNERIRNILSDSLMKCAEYGYCGVEINYDREDRDTLNKIPVLILHKDPSICFWDKDAMHPNKIDGRYCGIERNVSAKEIIATYPKLAKSKILKRKSNAMVDYWYREYESREYVLLNTGVYKMKNKLTYDDKNNLAKKSDLSQMEFEDESLKDRLPLEKTEEICFIYYKRLLNDELIESPRKFPTYELPLLYHDGLTSWHPDDGEFTSPLIYDMEGAQKLLNYITSQLATQAKNCSGDKWILSTEHVPNPSQQLSAKKINQYEGAFVMDGDITKIRREQPAQLSQSMIEYSNVVKNQIDEISGAMIGQVNPQQTILSGKAMDKFTHSMNMVNDYIIARHIYFVDTVGCLFKQMIPQIITEERVILIKNKDGSGKSITVNQCTDTGEISNNIKDINNHYEWKIKAGPNSVMQKENIVRYLNQIYQINPQFFQVTGDIYMRSLDTPYAGELERRVAATMDDDLIAYSQGEITKEQYKEAQQKKQEQQMKQHQMMSELDPQVKSANAMASAEHKKAEAAIFGKQTDRIVAESKISKDQQDSDVKLGELMIKAGDQHLSHLIDSTRAASEESQRAIDNARQILSEQQQEAQQQQQQPPQQGQQQEGTGEEQGNAPTPAE
jgi:hypothetical protein